MTLKRLIQSLDLSVSTGNYLLGVMKVKGKVIRHNLIPYAFVRKMVRTMGCFRNLISAGFVEEAQVFGRVLIETRINFEYFLQLAAKDCNSAISRVFDTIMLDKLKALHATNFRIGNRRVNRRRWAAIEAHIKKVYGDQIFKQLKQHGFSEMSLEARAIKTRNKPLYDLAYRLYSRSVHATDIIEQLKGISSTKAYTQREDAQFPAVLEAAVNCGIAINRAANQWLGDPLGLSKIERSEECCRTIGLRPTPKARLSLDVPRPSPLVFSWPVAVPYNAGRRICAESRLSGSIQ